MGDASSHRRKAGFLRGLERLQERYGFKLVGCGGCGCCASRECPAISDVGSGKRWSVQANAGDELEITEVK